jgi:hypothetical protein
MIISFVHSKGADAPITIPAIGLDLMVRMAPAASGGALSIIETINAPGKGPTRPRAERLPERNLAYRFPHSPLEIRTSGLACSFCK